MKGESELKVHSKTVQEFLRQAHVTTTLQLHAQLDMEAKRDAQGKFLEQIARSQDSAADGPNSVTHLGCSLGWKKIGKIV